jgi:hypothetical protein
MAKRITHKKPTVPDLPRPGDPLVLANGITVEPDKFDEVDEAPAPLQQVKLNAAQFRAQHKRSINELPDRPDVINAMAAVLMYTILGLSDQEISAIVGITRAEVALARKHSAYEECFNAMVSELINANSEVLSSRLAAHAHIALNQVTKLSTKAKKEETRLSASRDILDRAGVRPQDVAARTAVQKNELRIIITKGDEAPARLELNGVTIDGD